MLSLQQEEKGCSVGKNDYTKILCIGEKYGS